MQLSLRFLALASALSIATTVAADTNTAFDGRTFVNKGLVGFGRVSGDAKDAYGESLGGFGSAIALSSFRKAPRGGYIAELQGQPDRGYNIAAQTDYRARVHRFTLNFDPSKGSNTTENIVSDYKSTTLYRLKRATFNGDGNFTTGLDPTAVRPAAGTQPDLPIAPSDNHVAFDLEGLVLDKGAFGWISDEYGPHIHYVNVVTGQVVFTIQPPKAIVPMIGGQVNFTSNAIPDTGRAPNQGFEGLTLDRQTNTLWACLQSATAQDGGAGGKTTNRYTRLLGYKVSDPSQPELIAEYMVPLPQSSKGNTRATSEISIVDSTTFLILSRDGNGYGDSDSKSSYKQVDLVSTKGATNIANTKYDDPQTPAAPGGKLNSDITPAQYTSFVNLIQKDELAKFGLQVGGAFDRTLIAAKLESIALASVDDSSTPDDYFMFVVSDNDFVTNQGAQAAEAPNGTYVLQSYVEPYAAQYGTADTQIFVWRVTLPGASLN